MMLTTLTLVPAAQASVARRLHAQPSDLFSLVGPRLTSATDWWSSGVIFGKSFRLGTEEAD